MRMDTFIRWHGRFAYIRPDLRHSVGDTKVMKTTSRVPKANVLGVGVSVINLAQAARLILEAVRQNQKGYVAVSGVHGVSEAQADRQFRRILNSAFLNTPDGMPICWVGRFQGFKAMDRVYGPDLMLELCAASTDGSVRHFLYGGAPGVAETLRSSLDSRFPGLCVCGILDVIKFLVPIR